MLYSKNIYSLMPLDSAACKVTTIWLLVSNDSDRGERSGNQWVEKCTHKKNLPKKLIVKHQERLTAEGSKWRTLRTDPRVTLEQRDKLPWSTRSNKSHIKVFRLLSSMRYMPLISVNWEAGEVQEEQIGRRWWPDPMSPQQDDLGIPEMLV